MKKITPLLMMVLLCSSLAYPQYPRNQQIQAAEYFINSDPGEGLAIPINITTSPDVTINLNLNAPVGSKIYVRFQSTNGFWSAPRCIKRLDYFGGSGAAFTYGEYYINTDPGPGNGIQISFTNGAANLNNQNLQQGDVVYFRIKDTYNRWSPARGFKYAYKAMRRADYRIKLASTGNYTNPLILSTNAAADHTCPYSCSKNNIAWHPDDSIFIRYQTIEGFYSSWTNGIVADAGNDLTICEGESTTLFATGGQSYQWSDGQAGASINVAPDVTTIYGVTVSSGPWIISVDSVTVFVTEKPAAAVISQVDNYLQSNVTIGNQWYREGSLIPGETSQILIPILTGNYSVIVIQDGCASDQSNIIYYTSPGGIEESGLLKDFSIKPNPANDQITIESTSFKNTTDVMISIFDVQGQELIQQKAIDGKLTIDIRSFRAGIYFVKVKSGQEITVMKFIKK
ncbi:MAG: T9SS type A sorting domain-containing protein [Bacteroidota bacterium]